jgi:drug/metabolite transporter (DMT)-like permease
MNITSPSNTLVHTLMLLMVALVASSFPIGKMITTGLPPELLVFIRFLLAALCFAPYVFIKNGFHLPSQKKFLAYTVLSIPLVVFFWCMFEGLRYTSALNTSTIYTTVPAITALYVLLINQEKTSKRRALGLLLGTLGALWIIFRGDHKGLLQMQLNYGDALFMIGCLFMGAYNPLIKKLYSGEPMEVMTFWVICIGSVWLLVLALPALETQVWADVSIEVYAGIAYLSIFTTLITFFLLQFGTLKLGPTQVASYGFLTPIFVVILNFFIGTGGFQWQLLPGFFLVLIAMTLVHKSDTRVRLP